MIRKSLSQTWRPRPHDAIERLEPDLWAVQADVRSSMHIRCRMCIARLQDGRLVFMNAVPLSGEAMAAIEAWGTPAFLVAPTGFHTLDLASFKVRYPGIAVLAADGCRARIERFVPAAGGLEALPVSDRIRLLALRGTRGDVAARVGDTLCFPGDIFFNVPRAGGLDGLVFRLLGSIGGPRVTRIAKAFLVQDRRALREHLTEGGLRGLNLHFGEIHVRPTVSSMSGCKCRASRISSALSRWRSGWRSHHLSIYRSCHRRLAHRG